MAVSKSEKDRCKVIVIVSQNGTQILLISRLACHRNSEGKYLNKFRTHKVSSRSPHGVCMAMKNPGNASNPSYI